MAFVGTIFWLGKQRTRHVGDLKWETTLIFILPDDTVVVGFIFVWRTIWEQQKSGFEPVFHDKRGKRCIHSTVCFLASLLSSKEASINRRPISAAGN
jgi:hypothetical protein